MQTLMTKLQLSNNMETAQNLENKTIQDTVNNDEKQMTKTISPPKSGKSKNPSGIQHGKGDSLKWTDANLSRMSTNY